MSTEEVLAKDARIKFLEGQCELLANRVDELETRHSLSLFGCTKCGTPTVEANLMDCLLCEEVSDVCGECIEKHRKAIHDRSGAS